MSRSLRASAGKLVMATAVVVLGIGGTVASVATASPGRAAANPPPVDHQLCYGVSTTGSKIPSGIVLKNQFSPNGFKPKITKAVAHCNPVAKQVPSGKVFKITNPNAHLLCLPSWKSLTGPPHHKAPQPPRLNHFTCYPVKVASGAYHPPAVMLKDEFASKPVSATVNPVPVELCLPTEKIVGQHDFKIINANAHLLCYPVTPTPIKPTVWDQNQFGNETVKVIRTTTLCLPSAKQVVPR